MEKIKQMVEEELACIKKDGINPNNLDALYKLVDIHKDIVKEEMMNLEMEGMEGENNMRYNEGSYNEGNYNESRNYGRGRRRDSMGRFMEGNSNSGRRRYRGMDEGMEMMQRANENYEMYNDAMNEYNASGNYGAKEDGMESLEIMLQSLVDFYDVILTKIKNPEEEELIRKYIRKIKEM